jgi:chemotaxis protein methyltransferase CheR
LSDRAEGWVDAIRGSAERIEALTASHGVPAPAGAVARVNDLAGALELVRRERFADALAVIERWPVAGRDAEVRLLRALLLAHGGQLVAAEAACQELLATEPRSAGAHCALALCREAAGDRRAADEHDRTAAFLDPTFAMPRLRLGMSARRAGDAMAARRELGHALVLLARESPSRLLLFGGGFDRDALIALCRAELVACGGPR